MLILLGETEFVLWHGTLRVIEVIRLIQLRYMDDLKQRKKRCLDREVRGKRRGERREKGAEEKKWSTAARCTSFSTKLKLEESHLPM